MTRTEFYFIKRDDKCMKNQKAFYRILNIIGLFICIVGIIIFFLQETPNYGWFIVALRGALICSFANKTVYICPICGAKFESKDKIILTTGNFRRSLVTCPKCKKTNLCRSKRVCKACD